MTTLNSLSPRADNDPEAARSALARGDKILNCLALARLEIANVVEAVRLGHIRLTAGQLAQLKDSMKLFGGIAERIGKDTEKLREYERRCRT